MDKRNNNQYHYNSMKSNTLTNIKDIAYYLLIKDLAYV